MRVLVLDLSHTLDRRCDDYGHAIVVDYRRPRRDVALAMNGCERDARLQADAKRGECAFCLWAGLDPLTAIDWSIGEPDHGTDVRLFEHCFDIKTTGPWSTRLLWPRSKNSIFAGKRFDVMVLIKVAGPRCSLAGWITKQRFWNEKQVAPAGHALQPGTWYVDEVELLPLTVPSVWRAEF